MVDIEMLIRGLKCIAGEDENNTCEGCGYLNQDEECDVQVAKDALEVIHDKE